MILFLPRASNNLPSYNTSLPENLSSETEKTVRDEISNHYLYSLRRALKHVLLVYTFFLLKTNN